MHFMTSSIFLRFLPISKPPPNTDILFGADSINISVVLESFPLITMRMFSPQENRLIPADRVMVCITESISRTSKSLLFFNAVEAQAKTTFFGKST